MYTNDVMKLQSIIGSGELLNCCNAVSINSVSRVSVSFERNFMSVLLSEQKAQSSGTGFAGSYFDKLWKNYEGDNSFKEITEEDSVITDKNEDERIWKEYVLEQRKKRKMMEEMLVERKMLELERIASGGGKYGEESLVYLKGVPASELLMGIM